MNVAAVIFDFGNTLALPEDSPGVTAACLAEMGVPAPADELRRLLTEELAARRLANTPLETDWIACRRFHLERCRAILAGLGVGGNLDAKAAWFNELYEARSLTRTPHAGCREALDALAAAGLRLAVLSNSDGRAAARCAAMGIADRFEFVLDSALVGAAKPDPEIFRLALDRLALPAERVVSVGDDFTNDVACPKSLGMAAVYCNARVPPPAGSAVRANAVIRTLHELPAALGALIATRR